MTTYKTDIGTIKEELELKKMEGFIDGINITTSTIDDLDISDSLKERYGEKLIILDGVLYYNIDVVTDAEEQKWLEEMDVYPDKDITILKKYFFGEDGTTGRNITTSLDSNGNFINENNILEKECTPLTYVQRDIQDGLPVFNVYIKYNGAAYRIKTNTQFENGSMNMISESLDRVFTSRGNEGKDLGEITGEDKYNGWTILYDNKDGTVEAVSPEVLGSLTLGYQDETAISAGDQNIDKAIYSYNNAIDRLNIYSEEQTTDEIKSDSKVKNIRSIGSNPYNPYEDTNDYYELEGEYNKIGKVGDENYEQDLIRMIYYGAVNAGQAQYWMASRLASPYGSDGSIVFAIRYYSSEAISSYTLWNTKGEAQNNSYGVRPVIKVEI